MSVIINTSKQEFPSEPVIRMIMVGDDVHYITHEDDDGYTEGGIFRSGVPEWKHVWMKGIVKQRNDEIRNEDFVYVIVQEKDTGTLFLQKK